MAYCELNFVPLKSYRQKNKIGITIFYLAMPHGIPSSLLDSLFCSVYSFVFVYVCDS